MDIIQNCEVTAIRRDASGAVSGVVTEKGRIACDSVVLAGGVSGAAINPAVTLGADIMGMFAWSTIWVYLVAQVLGGIAAGLAFRTLNPADK